MRFIKKCLTCGAKHIEYDKHNTVFNRGCVRITERNYDKETHLWDIVKCRGRLVWADELLETTEKPKSKRKCGTCGKPGHNARTCKVKK